ncbi:Kelch-type beta propeller [Babesia duncani]|uniref:Kelch-type beta propeller n=1 Tax=Babesia duncani TaxID=323732 RepID=A0AAD9UP53_9APIC|nr:Kelch-type beta propeller [Babesia duncani]
MGKKSESKEQSLALKHAKQEKKARKKQLKETNQEDISVILKRHAKYIECADNFHGKWMPLENGQAPLPRNGSSFTVTNNGIGILFGGEFFDGKEVHVYNETFGYNFAKGEWSVLDTQYKPLPRCSHQAVYFNNAIYVFGGEFGTLDQFYHFNDMQRLCLKTLVWSQVEVTGDIPAARSGHRMILYKGYWVLFGGFHDTNKETHYFNNVYIFCFKSSSWTRIDQDKFSNACPQPRGACLFIALPNSQQALMYGGFTKVKDSTRNVSGLHHKDAWTLDLESACTGKFENVLLWQKVHLPKHPVSVGFGYAIYKSFCLVFGGVCDVHDEGISLKSVFYNDVHLLNIAQRFAIVYLYIFLGNGILCNNKTPIRA